MATRNAPGGPYVIQANAHSAEAFRQLVASLVPVQGIVNAPDLAVTQNGTPNMSVNVASGFVFITGTQSVPVQGTYHAYNDATVNLAVSASNPTNPRIDLVVAAVQDAAYSGATNVWVLSVIAGTPAGSPVPPAAPANSVILAQIAVAANANTVVNANITDKRPFAHTMGDPQLYKANVYYAAGTQTLTTGETTVQFDTIATKGDPNGNFNLSTHQYTVPITGWYAVSAGVGYSAAPGVAVGRMVCAIRTNSSNSPNGYIASSEIGPSATTIGATTAARSVFLNAGDLVYVNALSNPGGQAIVGYDRTFLSIHFLSR